MQSEEGLEFQIKSYDLMIAFFFFFYRILCGQFLSLKILVSGEQERKTSNEQKPIAATT